MSAHYPCPDCNEAHATTATSCPSVRGFVLAWQVRNRTVIGCAPCVRKALLREAGVSSLIGWFSPTAVILNPVFILWNLARAPFIRDDADKLARTYEKFGIPAPRAPMTLASAVAILSAAMVAADGRVEQAEVDTALRLGAERIPGFDAAGFHAALADRKTLPDAPQLAALVGEKLHRDEALTVLGLLRDIADADGSFDASERALLERVGQAMLRASADAGALDGLVAQGASPDTGKTAPA
ncbi:hypothetical protein HKCCE2091_21835 [Rhodobacterales bacterium HKCCE2091]|nr:hypothetical protein [Rhodobacterales bacterium HKCCE2091]